MKNFNAETQRSQSHAEKTSVFLCESPRPLRLCVKVGLFYL